MPELMEISGLGNGDLKKELAYLGGSLAVPIVVGTVARNVGGKGPGAQRIKTAISAAAHATPAYVGWKLLLDPQPTPMPRWVAIVAATVAVGFSAAALVEVYRAAFGGSTDLSTVVAKVERITSAR